MPRIAGGGNSPGQAGKPVLAVKWIILFLQQLIFCRKYLLLLRQNLFRKMNKTVEIQIFTKIKKARRGTLFFADGFASAGSQKAVHKALERLVKSGAIHRVATGMYVRPVEDKIIGTILPDIEEIARAIAKRDKARILPTGSYAMYKLGLTLQVPLNVVFYTDASSRKVKIGKRTITFKKTTARNLSTIGILSKLAIQSLKSIGKDNVSNEDIVKILNVLEKEKPYHLQHDLKLAPVWIRQLLHVNPEKNSR